MRKLKLTRIVLVGLCCLLGSPAIQAQRSSVRINGTIVGISGRFAGRSQPFSLIINSYTPPGEVRELNEALQRSEDELMKRLSKMNGGRIQIGSGVGVTANAIISQPWENGTKLMVLYQRNVNFYELRAGSRSSDYRFGYAEIFLDDKGKGQGTLFPAAKVRLKNGNTWEVEDFGVLPARLMGLRSSGRVLPS